MKKLIIIAFCFILLSQTVFADLSDRKDFKDGCYAVRENKAWALFNKDGKQLLPYNYKYISDVNEGLRYIEPVRKKVVYDVYGKKLYEFEKYSVEQVYKNTLALRYNNKYALATKDGKLITDFIYNSMGYQNKKDLIAVSKDEKSKTYIDETGKQILPDYYEKFFFYKKGIIRTFKNDIFYLYDFNGKLLKTCKKGIPEEKNCVITGIVIDDGSYDETPYRVFNNYKIEKAGIYREDTKEIITPATYPSRTTRVFNKYVYVEKYDGFKYIDEKGKVVLDIKNENVVAVRDFSDGLAAVRYPYKRDYNNEILDRATWGFMDKTGKIVIPTIFETVQDFKNGTAKVWLPNDKEPKYIDKSGNYVIKEQ